MIVTVNDIPHVFTSQKEVDKFIADTVKEHLKNPYFFNLEKIASASARATKYCYEENDTQFVRAANLEHKLKNERLEYLTRKSISETEPLKIVITQ